MKTPADTIVAAWIIALTGVGPSMASGSQTCNGNWADLPTVPMNRSNPISPAAESPRIGVGTLARYAAPGGKDLTVGKRSGGAVDKSDTQKHEHIADPRRHECLDAASRAEGFAYQNPINR